MDIETLAAKLHSIYQEESKRQGVLKHPDDYNKLPEDIKQFDRVLAKYILDNYIPKLIDYDRR